MTPVEREQHRRDIADVKQSIERTVASARVLLRYYQELPEADLYSLAVEGGEDGTEAVHDLLCSSIDPALDLAQAYVDCLHTFNVRKAAIVERMKSRCKSP